MDSIIFIFILLYSFLYVTHIIFGPYYLHYLFKNKELKHKSKNIFDILKKCVFITYISILFTIYFLMYPSAESFILAFLLTSLSLILYILKYRNNKTDTYYVSIRDHSLLLIPFIYFVYRFSIDLSQFKSTNLTYIFIIYLCLFVFAYLAGLYK